MVSRRISVWCFHRHHLRSPWLRWLQVPAPNIGDSDSDTCGRCAKPPPMNMVGVAQTTTPMMSAVGVPMPQMHVVSVLQFTTGRQCATADDQYPWSSRLPRRLSGDAVPIKRTRVLHFLCVRALVSHHLKCIVVVVCPPRPSDYAPASRPPGRERMRTFI